MKKSAITSAINAITRPSVPANAQYSAYVVSYKGYKRKWDARNDANFEKALKDLRAQLEENKPVEFALLVGYGDGKQFTEWKREVLYSNKSNAQKGKKKEEPSAKTEKTKPALKENKKPVKNTQKKAPVAPVAAASVEERLEMLEDAIKEISIEMAHEEDRKEKQAEFDEYAEAYDEDRLLKIESDIASIKDLLLKLSK